MALYDTAWYIHFGDGSTTGYYAVPRWAASTSTPPGTIRRQFTTPAVGSERVFVATQVASGNTGATEPTWVITRGGRTTDGGVTWTECTGVAALNGDTVNTQTWSNARFITTAVTQGAVIKRNSGTSFWLCSSAGGVMGASEPAFTDVIGSSIADNTCIWTCIALASAMPAPWGAPHARIANACAVNWGAAGHDLYLADNSAELSAAAIVFALGTQTAPCRFISVDHTAPVPPATTAAMKAGASITSSVNAVNAININNIVQGSFYMYGVAFVTNSAFSGVQMQYSGSQGALLKFENCSFQLAGSAPVAATISMGGGANTASDIELLNCTFSFCNAGQGVTFQAGNIKWRNTPHPCILGTALTATLIRFSAGAPATVLVEGVDLTAVGSAALIANSSGAWATVKNCKLHTGLICQSLTVTAGAMNVDMVACDNGANGYRTERYNANGTVTTVNTVTRQSGASDGVNSLSHFYSLSTNWRSPWKPMIGIPLYIWNNTVGSPVTVTVYGICFTSNFLWNDQIWMDVEYMGSSASPLATLVSTGVASLFDTHVSLTPDTSSAWCPNYPVRQNSTVYAGGAIFRVASNPNRAFFPSGGGGTTAASEPAWYATANDGDHAADGTIANVVVGQRFKMQVTVTLRQRGYITAYLKAAVGLTFYLDPQIVLS